MITFHSVTKVLGRGARRKLVLDRLDFVVPPRSHIVILGVRGAGKTTLLDIFSGTQLPTSGWVERRGVVSMPSWSWLIRQGSVLTTPRQLSRRLAAAYHADPDQIGDFVEEFAGLKEAMDLPTPFLRAGARQKLGLALFYGLPCDFYLFETGFETNNLELKDLCNEAYLRRREEAGMILVTHLPQVARKFGGVGAIIHDGKIVFFETVEDAISVFVRLEREQPAPQNDLLMRNIPPVPQEEDSDIPPI